MGRYRRVNQPNLNYHVINRGNNRDVIFAEPEDYRHYLNTIQRYKKKYGFKLYAYCLMTNHVHLLIKTTEAGNISRIMQSITVAHTRYYNYKYQRCGHVWQGRFMSPIVSEDEYFMTAMKYIEQNPLRARMVRRVEDYQWSSYRLNTRKKESVLVDRLENKMFQSLGCGLEQQIKMYKKIMLEDISQKKLEQIHYSTRKGGNFLSAKFEKQINLLLPQKRKRGRPKKEVVN